MRDWNVCYDVPVGCSADQLKIWVNDHPVKARDGRSWLLRFVNPVLLNAVLGEFMQTKEVDITALAVVREPKGYILHSQEEFVHGLAVVCTSEPRVQDAQRPLAFGAKGIG